MTPVAKGQVKYKCGYKYQLMENYTIRTSLRPPIDINTQYLSLSTGGVLTLRAGYCSDGPSGPTIDTKNFMRGAWVHDALYQLIRTKKLAAACRLAADLELRRICLDAGMSRLRAWWVYWGVRLGGKTAASPRNKKKIVVAP